MKYWEKFKMFWREIGNMFTNILCPLLSAITALLEIFGAPSAWIQGIKKAEHWCWNACGTKEEIDKIVESVDEIVSGDKNDSR